MVDLISVIKVFLNNLKYEDDYSEQSSASTSAYTMCVPNCISMEEDENYIDDSYPNSDFEILKEANKEEIEEELIHLQKNKQLENEIGCPLEVRCKLYNGALIYDSVFDKVLSIHTINKNSFECKVPVFEESIGTVVVIKRVFDFSDYKIGWWLKKDKSE